MRRNLTGIFLIAALMLVAVPAFAFHDSPAPAPAGGGGGGGDFDLRDANPISDVQDLDDVINKVATSLLGVAIPIAVLMYIYAGVLYITAGAKPQNVIKAKNVLLYTSIGLAIILIGGGFVDLIVSILNLGG